MLGVDDPEPAADDVLASQARAVGERQALPEVEDHAPAAVLDVPRRRQRRADRQAGIQRRERFEELGADRGGPHVSLRGRVDGHGVRRGEDPHHARVDLRCADGLS
jgi:hypothetical protein